MKLLKVILAISIFCILLGIVMLGYGMPMFAYRGEFSSLERDFGEICFVFWLPVAFVGVLLFATFGIAKAIVRSKIK